jgi:hypothetical protein
VQECTCTNSVVTRHQKRISGLLLDRIDIHMEVSRVDYENECGRAFGRISICEPAVLFPAEHRQTVGAIAGADSVDTAAEPGVQLSLEDDSRVCLVGAA